MVVIYREIANRLEEGIMVLHQYHLKRYFQFSSKQLSYHDDPNSPPKGIFEYSNNACNSSA